MVHEQTDGKLQYLHYLTCTKLCNNSYMTNCLCIHNVDVNNSVSDLVTKDNNTVNVITLLYYKYSSKNRSLQINIDCIIFFQLFKYKIQFNVHII